VRTTLAAAVAAPIGADAQPTKLPRIGILAGASLSVPHPIDGLRQGLRDLGYVDGRNIVIEYRWTEGNYERFPEYAAELVASKVDVIVAAVTRAALAAREATTTIPIVTVLVYDPVSLKLVNSLSRPGGNITGLTSVAGPGLYAKQLGLLTEISGHKSRIAVLSNPANPGAAVQVKEIAAAAKSSGVSHRIYSATTPQEIDRSFAAMAKERTDALIVVADPMFFDQRVRIADLAARQRLPSMYGLKEHADAGGLMSYSADFTDLYRRAATYVDKILKGAKPADLPVEQPTKFELVVNLKTAKAFSLAIPPSIVARADRVIE
jgi:putative ABC transport system substrate-binding protein